MISFFNSIQKPISNTFIMNIKENCLIACIVRQNTVIIPDGNSCIHLGDNVVVVTKNKNYDDLTDIFE